MLLENKSTSKTYLQRTDQELHELRQEGDSDADQIIKNLIEADRKHVLYGVLKCNNWADLEQLTSQEDELHDFYFSDNHLPVWADKEKMDKATRLFRSNGNEFLFMLGIVSLPSCYAAANGAIALYHTEKIRNNTEARLLETSSFVVDIMKKEAFENGGLGYLCVKQIRLRHALARYFLKRVPEVAALEEMPINQEDMVGTNIAFGYLALRAMPKIGVVFSRQTEDDYVHFWAVIGALMGIRSSIIPKSMREALLVQRKIEERHFLSCEEGQVLTAKLLDHYRENIPNKATVALIKPLISYMVGKDVAETIGLNNKLGFMPVTTLMRLLPIVKPLIFPPKQTFNAITEQIEVRKRDMIGVKA